MLQYACELEALQTSLKLRVILDQEAILVLYQDGQVFAIKDRCPHLGVSLEKGQYDPIGGTVTCRGHGAKINIKTGAIEEKAHLAFFKLPTKNTTTFSTKIVNNQVFIEK